MQIVIKHGERVELSKKFGVSLSLICFALNFGCNSLICQRIRHLAMNCERGIFIY